MKQQINHQRVSSSTIRTIGYDPEAQELHVDFHSSGRYVYHNVPQSTYEDMMQADSHGNFLHRHIKGKHAHAKR